MFHSAIFWGALVAGVVLHWASPARTRPVILAIISTLFIAMLDLTSCVAVLVLGGLVYLLTVPMSPGRSRAVMLGAAGILPLAAVVAVKAIQGPLREFRAEDYFAPIGLSYLCFKLTHYVIEVSRANITDRSPASFWAYLTIFPAYTAGPIERYDRFIANEISRFQAEHLIAGAWRMSWGLIKFYVLLEMVLVPAAERLPSVADVAADPAVYPAPMLAVVLLSELLLGYIAFSAYCDLAIGACRLFGYRIMENFRWPLLSRNISEFWQRWHISLVSWCRDYIYFPLLGRFRNPALATLVVFLVIGLWHGFSAPWIAWGLYNALGVIVHSRWKRTRLARRLAQGPRILQWWGVPLTIAFCAGWTVFPLYGEHGLGVCFAILFRIISLGAL